MSKSLARLLVSMVVVSIAAIIVPTIIGQIISAWIVPENAVPAIFYAAVTGILGAAIVAFMRLYALCNAEVGGPGIALCSAMFIWLIISPLNIGWAIVGAAAALSGGSVAIALLGVSMAINRRYARKDDHRRTDQGGGNGPF